MNKNEIARQYVEELAEQICGDKDGIIGFGRNQVQEAFVDGWDAANKNGDSFCTALKAEIVRKLEVHEEIYKYTQLPESVVSCIGLLKEILSFIDSLPEEPKFKVGDTIKKDDVIDKILDIDNN